jgi:molybdate transport system substrate-binding protein
MLAAVLAFSFVSFGALDATASASGGVNAPTITWVAHAVPAGSKIDMSKVMTTDSTGRRSWSTTGACSVRATTLVTRKTGTCRVTLRLTATSRHAATTSTTVIQVREKSELTVLAAASLTNAFTRIGDAFMARFLNVTVRFSFAGSSTLATQIEQGAPVDVVAMADTANMDRVVASGDVARTSVMIVARNRLAILVPRGNPKKITALSDLARPGVKVVLCDTAQPCGKYASTLLSNAKIVIEPASREASANGVVSRIANGEADAGIAYVTDGLLAGDKVDAVELPDSLNIDTVYPIAVVRQPSSRDSAGATAFVSMARGSVGREILANLGFGPP